MAPHPFNERRMIGYGFKLLHLNKTLSYDHSFNLLTRLNLDYGKKWRSVYVYAGISLNYFLHEAPEMVEDYKIRSVSVSFGRLLDYKADVWPGYEIGLHF